MFAWTDKDGWNAAGRTINHPIPSSGINTQEELMSDFRTILLKRQAGKTCLIMIGATGSNLQPSALQVLGKFSITNKKNQIKAC